MSNKKLDVFQSYDDIEMKRMQIVYMNKYGFSHEEIKKYTGYAVSTIKSYINKFKTLLDKACNTFYHITQKAKKQFREANSLYIYSNFMMPIII